MPWGDYCPRCGHFRQAACQTCGASPAFDGISRSFRRFGAVCNPLARPLFATGCYMQNPNAAEFQFCPFCGQPQLRAACVKSFACGACGRPFFINVAGAVAGLISDPEGSILVTVRKYNPAAGTWDLPGGFLNPGEVAEEALRREVREELGFDPGDLTYVCSMPNDYVYKGVQYATIDLLFRVQLYARPELTLDDEIAAAHWVAIKELDPTRFGLDSIRRIIQQVI